MDLGLIGAGRWGKVYIRTIEGLGPRLRLTHLATSRPENKTLVKGPVTLFSDWKQLIASDCDAVIIAAPAPLHAEMTRACLEARKPCIVEKPLCFDTATAESIRAAAEKAAVPVLVNYIHLFNPAYRALKAAIAAAGQPVRAIVSEGMDLGPFRPDTATLWDRCPHDLALCLDLIGEAAGLPEVRALGGCPDAQGRPEMVSIRLDWKEKGSAWIHAGRLSAKKKRALSVLTDSHLFYFDELDTPHCRKIPFDYTRRAEGGSAPIHEKGEPISVPDRPTPMEEMLTAFAENKISFPLKRTVELTRILETCQAQFV